MSTPLAPPYGINQPRTLNRWLDRNSQNGPLGRCNTFIDVPAFSVTWTDYGYSYIVAEFAFVSPNNFTIVNPRDFSKIRNFSVCVSYVNEDSTVVRYRLNRAEGEVMYTGIPYYVNERIKKNFKIEFWCVPGFFTVSQQVTGAGGDILIGAGGDEISDAGGSIVPTPSPEQTVKAVKFQTSVLQNIDQRFGQDVSLCVGTYNASFHSTDLKLPLEFPNNITTN